jgi:hypothetical protein
MPDGLTLADLRLEVKARCPKFLTDTRANMFVNQAYLQVCSAFDWDFLQTTVTGAAPLTLTRPQTVLSVVDTACAQPLRYIDRRTVVEQLDASVSQTGSPVYWWLEGDTLKVFPVSTGTLSVRLVQQPTPLALDADQVSVPLRFNDVLIDLATAKALRACDQADLARVVQQDADAGLERMSVALLLRNGSNPDFIVVYDREHL